MGAGVTLAVLGAILAFAVRQGPSPRVDLHVVGLILMAAGAALIAYYRRGGVAERRITRTVDVSDPSRRTTTLVETVDDELLDVEASGPPPGSLPGDPYGLEPPRR